MGFEQNKATNVKCSSNNKKKKEKKNFVVHKTISMKHIGGELCSKML